MIRFEICKGYEDKGINLPKRATVDSIAYDFECAEDITIPSIWQQINNAVFKENLKDKLKPTLIKTGIKAYFPDNVGLFLYNRSSNPGKKGLVLSNSVGIIDSGYVDNPDNDGDIMFAFYNFGIDEVIIKKGERIGQGSFKECLFTDDDKAEGKRVGGFGSTN